MARETKVGLIVGLGVILFVSVFVSDYLSVPKHQEALAEEDLPNFVDQTTNQPEFILTRESDTPDTTPPADPRELAAVSLEQIELRHGPPTGGGAQAEGTPPFRETGSALADDTTPIAAAPIGNPGNPVGVGAIDDPRLAAGNQLNTRRIGPGVDPLADLAHVEIPERLSINEQPAKIEHKVASGETLTAIARKHYDGDGNMWRSIRDANPGMVGTNGEIVQGVVLVIPKRSTEANDPASELSNRAAGNSERPARQRVRMVTVKEGETLSELAAEHLGSAGKWQLIMDVNADVLESPRQLRAGMKLRIPAEPVVELVEEANNALAGATDDEPPVLANEIERDRSNSYTVKEGDSLYRIAEKKLGNPERFNEIFEANRDKLASANDIRVGMKLKLPNR